MLCDITQHGSQYPFSPLDVTEWAFKGVPSRAFPRLCARELFSRFLQHVREVSDAAGRRGVDQPFPGGGGGGVRTLCNRCEEVFPRAGGKLINSPWSVAVALRGRRDETENKKK